MSNTVMEQVRTLDETLREQILEIWIEVTETGGAVGAFPGSPRERYEQMLADHEASMAAGKGFFWVLRVDGDVAGFAWWIKGLSGGDHVATIKRLQIAPRYQGLGLGRVFMDYLHSPEVLEVLDGVDFLHLQYRVGAGLGGWYATYGYAEIARYDLFRKNPDGTYGGWAEMLRTRDGSPLPVNGAL